MIRITNEERAPLANKNEYGNTHQERNEFANVAWFKKETTTGRTILFEKSIRVVQISKKRDRCSNTTRYVHLIRTHKKKINLKGDSFVSIFIQKAFATT